MVQYQPDLDRTFGALSDPSRREIVERLGRGPAPISELAELVDMTLTGAKKHVQILERAGLVSTEKQGRTRVCRLGPRRLEEELALDRDLSQATRRSSRPTGRANREKERKEPMTS